MEICPLCGSHESLPFITVKKWIIAKCDNCDLVFTKLPMAYDILKFNTGYYAEDYLSNYESRKDTLAERFLNRLKDSEAFIKGGNLLDVGCSTGLFLRTVHENSTYKWKLFGIDINRSSITFAQTKVSALFFCASLHKKKFKGNFFDCVTCFDVLEHDRDIWGNVKEIYRILKPGGLLVIQAPNYKSVMAYMTGENWDWWSVPDHILHFSPSVLYKILIDNGFIVKKLFTWEPAREFVENMSGSIKKKITKFMSLNRILSKLSIVPLYLFWIILWIVEKRFNIGGLIVLYAVKK